MAKKIPFIGHVMKKQKTEWSKLAKAAKIPAHLQEKVKARMNKDLKRFGA